MDPLHMAHAHANQFTPDFLDYLPENLHVYMAFEKEAIKVANRGFKHYSARTIVEVLRHHSALQESGSAWKLNDHNTPYLARLFALMRPGYAYLFEFRTAKSATSRHKSEMAAA
jgi:hypothetical protein